MAAPQGGGNQSDNSAGLLWGIAAIFAAIAGIWYAFKPQLIAGYLYIKLYEVDFLNLFFRGRLDNLHVEILNAIASAKNLSFERVLNLGTMVGDYVKFPFGVLFIILAFVVFFGSAASVFKRAYNMLDLAKEEKKNWPQITPILDKNLLKTDIDSGPWAMALQPMQFCKRYNLLEEIRPERREGMTRKEWDKIDVVLRRGDANRIFVMQLGPLWKGTNFIPPYVRALFAVFAARINADSKEAMRLLAQFSASSTQKSIDTRGVDECIKKHENTKLVKAITDNHAYVLTVMAQMLKGARDDGVQASADFLWLKPIDRRLWYMLNTVGRQTPFVEVAGPFAHWVAEREAARKLIVPMIEEATKALESSLKEIVYKRDEK